MRVRSTRFVQLGTAAEFDPLGDPSSPLQALELASRETVGVASRLFGIVTAS
jgi:hypothetical protein